MGNEANWNTFTQTGKVSDYLAYVREEKGRNGWENAAKEESCLLYTSPSPRD